MEDEPMTDERLAEIRERVAAWPKGYWRKGDHNAALRKSDEDGAHDIARVMADHTSTVELLAHAYTDMVVLLVEVERLRADNDLLEATTAGTESYCDRLRAENAAMRPIVEAVVTQGVYYTLTNGRKCYFCDAVTEQFTGEPPHTIDCPVTKARALVGGEA